MSKIHIEYYGMDGEGTTVREAKADAGKKIETVITEAKRSPELIAIETEAAIVAFHARDGWGYRIIASAGKFHVGPQWLNSGYGDKHDVMVSAFKHLIQNAWNHDRDDQGYLDDVLSGGCRSEHGCPLNHTDKAEIRREMLSYFAWQRRYRSFRDAGYGDGDCHELASNGPRSEMILANRRNGAGGRSGAEMTAEADRFGASPRRLNTGEPNS